MAFARRFLPLGQIAVSVGAGTGAYTLTGVAATLVRGIRVIAAPGSYVLTGAAAVPRAGRVIPSSSGSYALTGRSVVFTGPAAKVTAAPGSYALTGTAAIERPARRLPAASGSYSLTGAAAGGVRGFRVAAAFGSYALTGTAAGVAVGHRIGAASGSYSLGGSSVTLTPPGSLVDPVPNPNHTTFGAYTAGTGVPSGWTEGYDTGATWQVVSDGTAQGGKRLNLSSATNDRRFIYLNAAGDQTDVDLYARMKFTTGTQAGLRMRVNDLSGASEDGLYAYITDNTIEIGELTNGTAASIASNTPTVTAGTWYWMRWQTQGTTSRAKFWSGAADQEPEAWTISGTVVSHTGAGKLGIGARTVTTGSSDYDWFDWGFNGAAAFVSTTTSRVEANYDAGSVSEFGSSTLNGSGSTPAFSLHGRSIPADGFDPLVWWQWDARVVRVSGKTPTFRLYLTNPTSVLSTSMASDIPGTWNYKPYFSYDRETWSTFANYSTSAGNYQDFSHSSAFTSDVVYVRMVPGFSYSLLQKRLAALTSDSLVSQLSSWDGVSSTGAGKFRYNTTTSFTDDLGRTVPSLGMYGFKISDASLSMNNGTAKRKILLTSGVHSGEQEGQHVLWGGIDFLLSRVTASNNLLKRFDFYIYPNVNPAGVYAGLWRHGDASTKDANRHWNDTTQDFAVKAKAAILADTGGTCAMSLDCHAISRDTDMFGMVNDEEIGTGLIGTAWAGYVNTALTAAGRPAVYSVEDWTYNGEVSPDVPPGALQAMVKTNMSPYLALTAECGMQTFSSLTDYRNYGKALMNALGSMYDNQKLGAAPTGVVLSSSTGSYALTGTAAVVRRGLRVGAVSGAYAVTGTAAVVRAARRAVAAAGSYVISGVVASLQPGRRVAAALGAYALTGVAAGTRLARGLPAASGLYAVTGVAAGLRGTRVLAAGAGSYALSGTSAILRGVRAIVAAAGSYAVSGVAAALRAARALVGVPGLYALSGTAAGLRATRVLAAGAGSYALAGTAAVLRPGRALAAAAGAYLVSGQAAALRAGRQMAAAAGSYTMSGVAATAYLGRRLPASSGSYALTGAAAILAAYRRLPVGAGSYAIQGVAAAVYKGARVIAAAGAYALSGTSVSFRRTLALGAAVGGYALSGTAVSLRIGNNRVIQAATGAYTLSGTSVVLRAVRRLVTSAGSYAVTGQGAALNLARRFSASPGSYALSGAAAALVLARRLLAAVGSYAVSGTVAALAPARRLPTAPGAYSVTGTAAGLIYGAASRLIAGVGSYALSGVAGGLRAARRLVAAPGGYALTGSAVALRAAAAYSISAVAGSYAIAGVSAVGRAARRLAAAAGAYALAGSVALLRATRVMVANPGVLSLAGQPATGRLTRRLLAGPGAYAVGGVPTASRQDVRMSAATGSYLFTGSVAVLRSSARRSLTPEAKRYKGRAGGAATYTGQGGRPRYRA